MNGILNTPESMRIKLLERREIKASPDGKFQDCWYWTRYKNKRGYGKMTCLNGTHPVHRISMFLWKDFDLKSKLNVLHKCDNPPCFNPDHLFLGTNDDNMKDKTKKNKQLKGEQIGNSKLTKEQVLDIIILEDEGILTQQQIADKFGINRSHVSGICTGKTWKHI